jgi:quercetin dioxygenase-like cupin family protein
VLALALCRAAARADAESAAIAREVERELAAPPTRTRRFRRAPAPARPARARELSSVGARYGMIPTATQPGRRGMDSWDIASLDVEPHFPQVLRSDDETRAIAINLPAGERLQEHETHERAFLIVAEGEIELEDGDRTVTGHPGFLAHFEPHERREVRARTDARLILILAPWPAESHHT